MFAIALLVFGLITTALVWVVGFAVLVCAIGDNSITLLEVLLIVPVVSAWFFFNGDQTTASGILNVGMALLAVIPLLAALSYAFIVRPWTLLPCLSAIGGLVVALVILL